MSYEQAFNNRLIINNSVCLNYNWGGVGEANPAVFSKWLATLVGSPVIYFPLRHQTLRSSRAKLRYQQLSGPPAVFQSFAHISLFFFHSTLERKCS